VTSPPVPNSLDCFQTLAIQLDPQRYCRFGAPLRGFKEHRSLVQLEFTDAFASVGCLDVEPTCNVHQLGGSTVGRSRKNS
jgi:hypothetical protein